MQLQLSQPQPHGVLARSRGRGGLQTLPGDSRSSLQEPEEPGNKDWGVLGREHPESWSCPGFPSALPGSAAPSLFTGSQEGREAELYQALYPHSLLLPLVEPPAHTLKLECFSVALEPRTGSWVAPSLERPSLPGAPPT